MSYFKKYVVNAERTQSNITKSGLPENIAFLSLMSQ